jgi:DMSO/TMAO reductase YedYZ molybdopterin-dependent catalytic subunit
MLRRLLLAVVVMLACSACSRASANAPADWSVSVTGAVARPLALTLADLAARPQATLKLPAPHCADGKTMNAWVGPSLADVLREAAPTAAASKVTFVAQDGYVKDMPLAEAANAVLALQRDGKRLGVADKGPVWLIVPEMTANFWVGQLKEIRVAE